MQGHLDAGIVKVECWLRDNIGILEKMPNSFSAIAADIDHFISGSAVVSWKLLRVGDKPVVG